MLKKMTTNLIFNLHNPKSKINCKKISIRLLRKKRIEELPMIITMPMIILKSLELMRTGSKTRIKILQMMVTNHFPPNHPSLPPSLLINSSRMKRKESKTSRKDLVEMPKDELEAASKPVLLLRKSNL